MTETGLLSNTRFRLAAILALIAIVGSFVVGPLSADAKPKPQVGTGALTTEISGTVVNALGETVGTFTGTFTAQQFKTAGDTLTALGTVDGTIANLNGTTENVTQQVTMPVDIAQATCEILSLTLGPLDLDLLGLIVQLDTVDLQIDAQQGPGNLLGNLLCAVAGLLDNGLSLNLVADLLNVVVDVLKELGLA